MTWEHRKRKMADMNCADCKEPLWRDNKCVSWLWTEGSLVFEDGKVSFDKPVYCFNCARPKEEYKAWQKKLGGNG